MKNLMKKAAEQHTGEKTTMRLAAARQSSHEPLLFNKIPANPA